MLKRGPMIAIGILAVVLLGTPYAIGMINENAMVREVERISGQGVFTPRIESLDRGWFSTRAVVVVGLDPDYLAQVQGADADPMMMMFGGFTLPVIVEIGHGPVLLASGAGFGTASVRAYVDPASELAILAEQWLGMPYLIELRGRSGFGAGFDYEGEIPPIDFAMPEITVSSTGLDFAGTWNRGDNAFTAELGSLMLQSPFASAILEALEITSDMSQPREGAMPLGTGTFALGRVTLTDPLQGAAPVFSAEDASVTAAVTASDAGDYVDMQILYRVGSASVSGEFEMSDASMGFTLGHIDAAAADAFYSVTESLSQTTDPDEMLATLMPIADRIVAGAPTLSIDPLAFSMPEGNLTGTVSVALDPAALPNGRFEDLQDPAVMLAALSAEIDIAGSKPLIQRLVGLSLAGQMEGMTDANGEPLTPEEAEAMAAGQAGVVLLGLAVQGLIADEAENYTTTIRIENGLATANGQPIPLAF